MQTVQTISGVVVLLVACASASHLSRAGLAVIDRCRTAFARKR